MQNLSKAFLLQDCRNKILASGNAQTGCLSHGDRVSATSRLREHTSEEYTSEVLVYLHILGTNLFQTQAQELESISCIKRCPLLTLAP